MVAGAAVWKVALELLVVTAALLDIKTRRIPNWLTLPGLVVGIALHQTGIRDSLTGAGLAFLVYFALFAIRAMGGGDVKLMSAVGAFVGWKAWLWIFAVTAMTGGAFVIVSRLIRGDLGRVLGNVGTILGSWARGRAPHTENPELDVSHPTARTSPHGAFIAVGTILYLLIDPK